MAPTNKQWADGPFELIPASIMGYKRGEQVKACHKVAEDMITVHNDLLRGINSIYLQCKNVEFRSPDSVPDFVEYARMWVVLVQEHHDNEESFFFQQIEEMAGVPGLMAPNVEQHAAFHGGLEAFHAYVEAVRAGEDRYDGQRLGSLIDSFMPVLRQHLVDEIKTLLALDQYEDRGDWAAWMEKTSAEIVANLGADPDAKYTAVPMVMVHHDNTFGQGMFPKWPPMPWIVRLMVSWVFARRHRSWWRFAPCDINGNPREMPFVD